VNEACAPRRRWFQFGIGSMLLLVTAFAVWLGWGLQRVREREAMLKYLATQTNVRVYNAEFTYEIKPWKRLPLTGRLLGAEPIHYITLPKERYLSEEDRQRIASLFPEASVVFQ
jgi:hypothetical protein